ncbi:MAG: hypothetical protein KTR23_08790 [Rhodospirillales bacterium]|nr:hypothetical protein [Rhodospirillales bacterium]
MNKPEKNPNRPQVDLPENRHRWASNDQVEKPRFPVRGPNILVDDFSAYHTAPRKSYLPKLAAYAIAGTTLLIILIYIYVDLSSALG